MHPIPGVVEEKVARFTWAYVCKRFNRNRDLQRQVESLQAQLAEERSGKLAFETLIGGLVCRPEDDHMYWKRDGSGGPYCPTCLHGDKTLMPLIHGNRDGCFYCNIHKQHFETEELRQRTRNIVRQSSRPRRYGIWS